MTVYHQKRTLGTQVGILISLVLPALFVLWMLWIWLGYSPTGGPGLLHP
jgi:hypothetical protein